MADAALAAHDSQDQHQDTQQQHQSHDEAALALFLAEKSRNRSLVAVSAGRNHKSIIVSDGTVYCVGCNSAGQLGLPQSVSSVASPTRIDSLSTFRVVAAACGDNFTVVLTSTNKAYSFGDNSFGQLGHQNSSIPMSFRPKAVSFSAYSNDNNTVDKIKSQSQTPLIVSIAACSSYALFLTSTGEVFETGVGGNQTSDSLTTDSLSSVGVRKVEELVGVPVLSIGCGSNFGAALTVHGTIYTWSTVSKSRSLEQLKHIPTSSSMLVTKSQIIATSGNSLFLYSPSMSKTDSIDLPPSLFNEKPYTLDSPLHNTVTLVTPSTALTATPTTPWTPTSTTMSFVTFPNSQLRPIYSELNQCPTLTTYSGLYTSSIPTLDDPAIPKTLPVTPPPNICLPLLSSTETTRSLLLLSILHPKLFLPLLPNLSKGHIDILASWWRGPCVQQFTNLVKIYNDMLSTHVSDRQAVECEKTLKGLEVLWRVNQLDCEGTAWKESTRTVGKEDISERKVKRCRRQQVGEVEPTAAEPEVSTVEGVTSSSVGNDENRMMDVVIFEEQDMPSLDSRSDSDDEEYFSLPDDQDETQNNNHTDGNPESIPREEGPQSEVASNNNTASLGNIAAVSDNNPVPDNATSTTSAGNTENTLSDQILRQIFGSMGGNNLPPAMMQRVLSEIRRNMPPDLTQQLEALGGSVDVDFSIVSGQAGGQPPNMPNAMFGQIMNGLINPEPAFLPRGERNTTRRGQGGTLVIPVMIPIPMPRNVLNPTASNTNGTNNETENSTTSTPTSQPQSQSQPDSQPYPQTPGPPPLRLNTALGPRPSPNLLIPGDHFINAELNDCIDIPRDYFSFLTKSGPSFVKYPFALSTLTKHVLLAFSSSLPQLSPSVRFKPTPPIKIRRDHLMEDTFKFFSENTDRLQGPPRIEFDGEVGLDSGGLFREYIRLFFQDLFQLDMFVDVQESTSRKNDVEKALNQELSRKNGYIWFNHDSCILETGYKVVGRVLALSFVFGGGGGWLQLPPVFWRCLIGWPCHDVEWLDDVNPSVANGLRQVLEMKRSDVEDLCLEFSVAVEEKGCKKVIPLPGYENGKAVTGENVLEYVDAMVKWHTYDSVRPQLEAFKEGFLSLCGGVIMDQFRYDEIRTMLGSEKDRDYSKIDFKELEEVAEYKLPYSTEHPVIKRFWHVFHKLPLEYKFKFLRFMTGTDRIPRISGLKSIRLCFQPCGGNSVSTTGTTSTISQPSEQAATATPTTAPPPSTQNIAESLHELPNQLQAASSSETHIHQITSVTTQADRSPASSSDPLPSSSSSYSSSSSSMSSSAPASTATTRTTNSIGRKRTRDDVDEAEKSSETEHLLAQIKSSRLKEEEDKDSNKKPRLALSSWLPDFLGSLDTSLNEMTVDETVQDERRLPCAHTCTLVLDLPMYRTVEVLCERLVYAVDNGAAFHII